VGGEDQGVEQLDPALVSRGHRVRNGRLAQATIVQAELVEERRITHRPRR
jgi:hypothetical protein